MCGGLRVFLFMWRAREASITCATHAYADGTALGDLGTYLFMVSGLCHVCEMGQV